MTADAEEDLPTRLRAGLRAAMKARDTAAVTVLRSTLSAIDNAGAVDEATAGLPVAEHARLAGTAGSLGAGEAPRASLAEAQHREIVAGEVEERRAAADEYARHGRDEHAARLREEADLLAGFLAQRVRGGSSLAMTTTTGPGPDPEGRATAALIERWKRSQVAGYGALTAAADPGEERSFAGGDVRAFRVPAMAEVSVSNGVVCDDPDRLDDAFAELASWYDGLAWAVWLAPWQLERGARVLERRGFALDESARVMAGWLDELDLEPRAELDLAPAGSWDELVAVVDAGFGMPDGLSFAPAFAGTAPRALQSWVARVDGRAAACAASVVHDGDVWFALVATRPEHRGRGLGTELMRTALRAAGAEGCTSTSLEASALGRPVYARLGYRDLGETQLWERSPASAPA